MSKTILIVDDEAFAQKAIRQMLENNGYSVLSATDGSTAVSFAMF